MNDEIKEIIDMFTKYKDDWYSFEYKLKPKQCVAVLDYITNLQQENEHLRTQVNTYENPDDYTLFYMWLDAKAKDKIKQLQEENERLNNIINELEKYLKEIMESYGYENDITDRIEKIVVKNILNKLKELKEGK